MMSTQDLIEVFAWDTGDYEWSELHVYRHPRVDGAFFTHDESGCSCNIYEGPEDADIAAAQPLNPGETIAAFTRWWDDNESRTYENMGTKAGAIERLVMALRG